MLCDTALAENTGLLQPQILGKIGGKMSSFPPHAYHLPMIGAILKYGPKIEWFMVRIPNKLISGDGTIFSDTACSLAHFHINDGASNVE